MFKTDRLGILGIPFGGGQAREGLELGPSALRAAGLEGSLASAGWKVADHGDVAFDRMTRSETVTQYPFKHGERIALACREIADRVAETLTSGQLGLQLGGDHGIALGTIAGALRVYPELRVLWVDAHGDSNTPETSPSGNFHGMPLAALMGLFRIRELPGFEWLGPILNPKRVALVGVRDLDPGEKEIVKTHGIIHYEMDEIRSRGMSAVIRECLHRLDPDARNPIHYSLDIDALDPALASATGLPVADGLTLADMRTIGDAVAETGRLVSMDLVEINPSCGDARLLEVTLDAGIQSVMASVRRVARAVDPAA